MLSRKPGNFPVALLARLPADKPQDDDIGWVAQTLAKPAPIGKRNDTLCSLAGYLALSGVGPNVAVELLGLWNGKNNPPLSREEIETSIKSIYRTAKNRTTQPGSKEQELETFSKSFDLMDFSNYMTKYYGEEQKWLIDKWLPAQTMAFIVSPPGGHKTWLLLDLAVSIASGTPFLGMYPVLESGPVIIIQQEDFHGQIVERLSLIVHNRFGINQSEEEMFMPPKLPIFIHPDRKLKFSDEKVMRALEEQVEKVRPKLVIIDPLYSAASMDNYMADTATEMFALKAMRDKYGTGFVVAHHTKKGADGDRERAWGSQFLNAFLETGWQIKSGNDSNIKIRRHFKQFADQKEVGLKFDIDTEDAYHYQVKETKISAEEKAEDKVKAKAVKAKMDIDEIEIRPSKALSQPNPTPDKHTKSIVTLMSNLSPNVGKTAYELSAMLDVDVVSIRPVLKDLVQQGLLIRDFHTHYWNRK